MKETGIRRTSGWEKNYGRYVVFDNVNLTETSTGNLLSALKLWVNRLKSKNIERCCR